MKLSIVIPTKNEEKKIKRLIDSILNDEVFDANYIEIIVVDNPDTVDNTGEIVSQYNNVDLYTIGPERSAQRNYGASRASGEYLFFVDADMYFRPGLLEEILDIIKKEHRNNIAITISERVPGESLYCRSRNLEKRIYHNNPIIYSPRLVKRDVFLEIEGYDTQMVMGEDWDLNRRIKQAGAEIIFASNYICHDEVDLGFIGMYRKYIYYAKTLRKHRLFVQKEVNPIYRYMLLISKPKLIVKEPLAFSYLLVTKTIIFGSGFVVYVLEKVKSFQCLILGKSVPRKAWETAK